MSLNDTHGHVDWDEYNPRVLARYPLTSDDVYGRGQGSLSNATIDANGLKCTTTGGYLEYAYGASTGILPSPLQGKEDGGFHITAWFESAALFDEALTPHGLFSVLFAGSADGLNASLFTSGGNTIIKAAKVGGTYTFVYAANAGVFIYSTDPTLRLTDEFTRVDFSFTSSYIDIWLDYLHVFRNKFTKAISNVNQLGKVRIGCNSTGTAGFLGYIKNLQVVGFPKVWSPTPGLGCIAQIGDSLTANGNWATQTELPMTATSTTFDPVASGSAGTGLDLGCAPSMTRTLSRNNVFTCIRNYGVTGAGASTGASTPLINQINGTISPSAYAEVPHVIDCMIGTNDVKTYNDANFNTGMRAVLDNIVAQSDIRYVLLYKIPSLNNSTLYDGELDADLDTLNARIDAYAAEYNALYGNRVKFGVVDLFTPTGGHNPDVTCFVTDDLHFNVKGQYLKGDLAARKLLELSGRPIIR